MTLLFAVFGCMDARVWIAGLCDDGDAHYDTGDDFDCVEIRQDSQRMISRLVGAAGLMSSRDDVQELASLPSLSSPMTEATAAARTTELGRPSSWPRRRLWLQAPVAATGRPAAVPPAGARDCRHSRMFL